jgi:hypothetical protein
MEACGSYSSKPDTFGCSGIRALVRPQLGDKLFERPIMSRLGYDPRESHCPSRNPTQPKAQADDISYTSQASQKGRHRTNIQKPVRVHPLPPAILSEDDCGESSPVFSVATPCARAQVPVVAHRRLRAVTGFCHVASDDRLSILVTPLVRIMVLPGSI